jgi:hypothetical protein
VPRVATLMTAPLVVIRWYANPGNGGPSASVWFRPDEVTIKWRPSTIAGLQSMRDRADKRSRINAYARRILRTRAKFLNRLRVDKHW